MINTNKINFIIILYLGLALTHFKAISQTTGLIYEAASGNVLDINGDGYITNNGGMFSSDGDDTDEFEGTGWARFPTIGQGEKLSDIQSGPDEGFSDFSVDPAGYATYMRIDGQNLMFRFRLADFRPNAKGYTVLLDTDGLIGPSDSDTYKAGENPGFELAVLLKSKHGVYIIDFDADPNDGSCEAIEYSYLLSNNHQKSISGIASGGNPDAFYDFYVPLSDLYAAGGITSTSGLRFAATTNTSNSCTFQGSVSDIGGMDDDANPCLFCALEELINRQTPTSINDISAGGLPTTCPSLPIEVQAGSNVIVDGVSLPGSTVRLYINGSLVQTTSADATTGDYSFTLISILAGDVIAATAEDVMLGLSESNSGCNTVVAIESCANGPNLSVTDPSGNSSILTGTTEVGLGIITDLEVQVRLIGSTFLETGDLTAYNDLDGTWEYILNSDDGDNKYEPKEYEARIRSLSGCWSEWVIFCGQSNAPKGETPIVIAPTGSIIPGATVNFSGTVDIVNVNGVDGAFIYLIQDGIIIATTEVSGTKNQSGVPWAISNISIGICGDVDVYSLPRFAGVVDGCRTPQSDKTVVQVNGVQSETPQFSGSYCGDVSLIEGTSNEPEGSIVSIYGSGAVFLGVTEVSSFGSWSYLGNIPAGSTVYATVQNTLECESESSASASLTIGIPEVRSLLSITDPPINELSSSIEVTGVMSGDILNVYADGTLILSTTVTGTSHTFNLPGDYLDPEQTIYAGASLTATSGSPGNCESAHSTPVVVACELPDPTLLINSTDNEVCTVIENGIVIIENSVSGVIYTPFNINDLTTPLGLSRLGTGGDLELDVGSFTSSGSETVTIKAEKYVGISCDTYLDNTQEFIVNPLPDISNFSVGNASAICPGQLTTLSISSSSLIEGSYIITYDLSAPNTSSGLIDTIFFSNGTGMLETNTLSNSGATTLTITEIANESSGCSRQITVNNTTSISIGTCDNPPVLSVSNVSVDEGVLLVLTATATDMDAGDTQAYSITGVDSGLFDIDPLSGDLTFKVASDFENPTDAGVDNIYDIEVTVTDAVGNTDLQSIQVTVVGINDNDPIVVANNVSVSENEIIVQTVTATDADIGDNQTFSISGADAALFSVDNLTGELVFINPPDFENPLDAGSDNIYDIEVIVTDAGGNTDTQSIQIMIIGINDNQPLLEVDDNIQIPEGTTSVTAVQATDEDDGDTQYFSITGVDANLFSIDANTGLLEFVNPPDYGNPGDANSDNIYELEVTVVDNAGNRDTKLITISVIIANNSDPVVSSDNISINEGDLANGLNVLDNDYDPDGDLLVINTSPILDVENGLLTINKDGTFTYAPYMNFVGIDKFTYEVCDTKGGCAIAEVIITVLAVDYDLDKDGISNIDEGEGDTDNDGIPDKEDTDSDNDGIPDAEEGNIDSDGDGMPDYKDFDSDHDGIPDAIEGNEDADGDNLPNYLDDDSDGDGIPDSIEENVDTDDDGNPDYLDLDSDDDGIPDAEEGNIDTDYDGTPNFKDLDSDDDGISDEQEANGDCDEDGIPNYIDDSKCDIEISKGFSPNGDGENDEWRIEGIESHPENNVKVFNRWGNLVFDRDGYDNEDTVWYGQSEGALVIGGNEVTDGTYFYVVNLKDGSKPASGYVIVKR